MVERALEKLLLQNFRIVLVSYTNDAIFVRYFGRSSPPLRAILLAVARGHSTSLSCRQLLSTNGPFTPNRKLCPVTRPRKNKYGSSTCRSWYMQLVILPALTQKVQVSARRLNIGNANCCLCQLISHTPQTFQKARKTKSY